MLHVHDLADNVTAEAERAGAAAAAWAKTDGATSAAPDETKRDIVIGASGLAGYVVPSRMTRAVATKRFFRVKRPVEQARLVIRSGEVEVFAGKPRAFKPSIMESAPLTPKMLERVGDELILSVEPVEEM